MLMQQGGAGNMPAMQPGAQQASIAPISPQSQMQRSMTAPSMDDGMNSVMFENEQALPAYPPSAQEPRGQMDEDAYQYNSRPGSLDMTTPGDMASDDPVRDETEGELANVRAQMGGQMGDDEAGWEGEGTPTAKDLAYVKENPTDGVLADFFQTFPDYMRELVLSEGGDPSSSPDEYAMTDEDWEETQSGRTTRTDEK